MVSQLAHYEERAKTMAVGDLLYAIRDIKSSMENFKDRPLEDPYVTKLYAEFDAYTVEIYNRRKG